MLDIRFINLDRSVDRLQAFRQVNAHLPDIARFTAVDGAKADRAALAAAGTLAADLAYTPGAVGCALSHIALWREAAAGSAPLTICEDDAVLHSSFADVAPRLIGVLPADWDIVVWGWNFDTVLLFDVMPGISPCIAAFDQDQLRRSIDLFQQRPANPRAYRLLQSFGTIGYTVSPAGARMLLARCLPLRPLTITVPRIVSDLPNTGIDIVMNTVYPKSRAFVSFPPMVVTRNDKAASTVQSGP
jgi:GR25 family glycosyltransferase involved in LPS biosynthesis